MCLIPVSKFQFASAIFYIDDILLIRQPTIHDVGKGGGKKQTHTYILLV